MENNQSKTFSKTFGSQFFRSVLETTFDKKVLAVKNDKIDYLDSFCRQQKQIKETDEAQKNLLHFSAFFNSSTTALYLVYKGINIQAKDNQGKKYSHLCAYTGHLQTFKMVHNFWKLLKIRELNQHFIQLLTKSGFKRTDVKNGQLKISVSKDRLKKFIKMQQDLCKFYQGYIKQYTIFILKQYIETQKISNKNCFHFVCLDKYQKCSQTLSYMIKSLKNQHLQVGNDLLQAIYQLSQTNFFNDSDIDPRRYSDSLNLITSFLKHEDLKRIQEWRKKQINQNLREMIEAKDKDGHTPLFLSSKSGNTIMIAQLQKLKGKVNQKQDLIKIANNNMARSQILDLCQASKISDLNSINFLISCGQNINKKKSIFGTFALLQAVKSFKKQKNIESIRALLKSGADVNEQDTNGWTILHHIAQRGQTMILQQIFKQHEQGKISKLLINKLTNKGFHMLHMAAMNDQEKIIQILLQQKNIKKYGITINPLDSQMATILHSCAKKGCLNAMKAILKIKGKQLIYKLDVNDNSCLHLASANNHYDCIKQLLFFDSDYDKLIHIKNKKGKFAKQLTLKKGVFENIFTSAREGNVNLIRKLITQEPKLIDSTTIFKKRTPLILSVMTLNLVNVKFLVQNGADQYHQDQDGKSAKTYAQQKQKQFQKNKDKNGKVIIKNIISLLG